MFGSLTMGAGQFCTKPGLVFLPENGDATNFVDKLGNLVVELEPVQYADVRYTVGVSIRHRTPPD